MWLEKINNIKLENLTLFNLRNELHFALFTMELLKDKIEFKLKKDKSLEIIKNKKEIKSEQLLYWLQIILYQEITLEENKLITTYEKIPKTIQKLQNSLTKLTPEKNETKILETNIKIQKLSQHMKIEENKLKENLTKLGNFKNSFSSKELLNKLLSSITIYLQNS